ncbi:MAG: hypothetical protein E7620_08690 [Ruminococcaceae bacterium]|nr:hypothetical protein [Oscillospiraceae bacterium]
MKDWKYRPKTEEERLAARKEEEVEETPESFASKHVKSITFFICLGVLLALIGPFSVFYLYEQYQERQAESGVEMTVADLVTLSRKGVALKLEDITVYRGDWGENDLRITYSVMVDHYVLFAVHNKESKTLDFCLLTDAETGDSIDIRADDVQAFLASH